MFEYARPDLISKQDTQTLTQPRPNEPLVDYQAVTMGVDGIILANYAGTYHQLAQYDLK